MAGLATVNWPAWSITPIKNTRAKVKFLNFREAQERINKNLLVGQPLRAANGEDNGVRLMDLNNDGFMDVVIGNEQAQKTRIWNPKEGRWIETSFPTRLVTVDAASTATMRARVLES